MLNYDFILKKSNTSHIDRITIEREYWQLIFLQQLYVPKNSDSLFFKGGTAIRFLFNSFRFSEDLDFTSTLTKKETESLLSYTFNFFHKNASEQIEIKKEPVFKKFEENSLKYRFLFTPYQGSQKTSIRIDVSFREKPQAPKKSVLVPFDYPISPYPLVVHLGSGEILAEKIRALLVRSQPRDLFDIWFLLTQKIPIDEKIIEKKMTLYPDIKFNINTLNQHIQMYDEKKLKMDLNQFLPIQYRTFYKELKNKTLEMLS
ncbi:MAG TPA: nucleotidyl transferase AbiEii/AbiGii toxin family protein [Patescibacteria group bacterium]|nr:nucleotidyl transferase AbiEii/AbiGii toxin family protein [Patescibacteria group bacterium]